MNIDPTLMSGTYETTGIAPGTHADVTRVTATNFKEIGSNPAGIADWEAKFEILHTMRQEAYRRKHGYTYVATMIAELANGTRA